jgi:hypothetical protein
LQAIGVHAIDAASWSLHEFDRVPACVVAGRPQRERMEIGFWENFAPSPHSQAHCWDIDQWKRHLDEMARHDIRLLTIYLRWYSTGYRSVIPFLDRTPSANADSGNRLLPLLIGEAHRRGIKVFAANHTYIYLERLVGTLDRCAIDDMGAGNPYWPHDRQVTLSADSGHTREIVLQMFEEQFTLFPELDGFVYEGERKYFPGPGSRRAYTRWSATQSGAMPYDDLQPERFFDWIRDRTIPTGWVSFVSDREGRLVREVLETLRGRGFAGEMFYCYGTSDFTPDHMLDPTAFRGAAGEGIGLMPYNYDHPTAGDKLARIADLKHRHGFDLMYVVDGQVGWHRSAPESDPGYMDAAWAEYVRQARVLDPRYFVFFGYEWNALRNGMTPRRNRDAIYGLLTSAAHRR